MNIAQLLTESENRKHKARELSRRSSELSGEIREAEKLLERTALELEQLNRQLSGLFCSERAVDELTRLLPRQAALTRVTCDLAKHIDALRNRRAENDEQLAAIEAVIRAEYAAASTNQTAPSVPAPKREPTGAGDWAALREMLESLLAARQMAERSLAVVSAICAQQGGDLAQSHQRATPDVLALREPLQRLHATLTDEGAVWHGLPASVPGDLRAVADQLRQTSEAHATFVGQLCSTFQANHHSFRNDAAQVQTAFAQFADYAQRIIAILDAGRLHEVLASAG